MNDKIKSSESNQIIIEAIKNKLDELIKTGSTLATASEEVHKLDDGRYIPKDQLNTYEKLAELNNYINFNEENKSDVYVFNMPRQNNKQFKKMKQLYVPVKDAEKLVDIAAEIEKMLNIKFPQELYQLKHKTTLLPNHNYEAPYPRLASETEEQYEERLANHYNQDGTKTEMIEEDSNIRKPYPHETIDYKKDKIEYSDSRNSYYENYVVEKTKEPFRKRRESTKQNVKNIGKLAVKSVKEPSERLLTNIKNLAKDCKLIPNYFKNRMSTNPKLVVAATAGTAITVGIIGMQVLTGIATFTLPGLIIEGVAISMVYKDFKKWKKGRKKPEEPENTPPKTSEKPTTEEPTPQDEEELTGEIEWTYEEFMAEFGAAVNVIQKLKGPIAELESKKALLIEYVKEDLLRSGKEATDSEIEKELATNEEYIAISKQLKELYEKQKTELIRVHEILENINKVKTQNNEVGGRTL